MFPLPAPWKWPNMRLYVSFGEMVAVKTKGKAVSGRCPCLVSWARRPALEVPKSLDSFWRILVEAFGGFARGRFKLRPTNISKLARGTFRREFVAVA